MVAAAEDLLQGLLGAGNRSGTDAAMYTRPIAPIGPFEVGRLLLRGFRKKRKKRVTAFRLSNFGARGRECCMHLALGVAVFLCGTLGERYRRAD